MPEPKCPTCNDTEGCEADQGDGSGLQWYDCQDCNREALFARIEALEAEMTLA